MFLVSCSAILWPFQSLETDSPDYYILIYTLRSESSTIGQLFVVWHLRDRLACIAFYTA